MKKLTFPRFATIAWLAAVAALEFGCSASAGEVSARPHGDSEIVVPNANTATGSAPGSAACADGQTRPCSFHLPEHNGVHPCIVGAQACIESQWQRCIEGASPDSGILFDPNQYDPGVTQEPEQPDPGAQADGGAMPDPTAPDPNAQADAGVPVGPGTTQDPLGTGSQP